MCLSINHDYIYNDSLRISSYKHTKGYLYLYSDAKTANECLNLKRQKPKWTIQNYANLRKLTDSALGKCIITRAHSEHFVRISILVIHSFNNFQHRIRIIDKT